MMHAYSEKYLHNATGILADMMDYAINDCSMESDMFAHMFVVSGASKEFERGNLRYVVGRSGIEIANEMIRKIKGEHKFIFPEKKESKSPEYWAGWALAQYQWYTAKSFENIFRSLPLSDIIGLYPTLHEADITKFYSVADEMIDKESPMTNLKSLRNIVGITQEKLAKESGVSLRSIQMYEQRNKDINKAQAITLVKMSRVLFCEIEDLLES